MTTCTATWTTPEPGSCTRDATSGSLCAGHRQQAHRQGRTPTSAVYRPLRAPHGADPRTLVPVSFSAPADDVGVLEALADTRGRPRAELYREALAQYVERLGTPQ